FVAWDDPRREEDGIVFAELEVVIAASDASERGAGLALPARGDDQHLASRQAHRLVKADRLREVREVAGGLRNPQDAVERAAGDAHLAAGLPGDAADGLQSRRIGF